MSGLAQINILLTLWLPLWAQVASPQTLKPSDIQQLSGRWEGDQGMLQQGSCGTGRGRAAFYPYRLDLIVNSDGAVTGEPLSAGTKNATPTAVSDTWTGKIAPDMTVTMNAPLNGMCNVQPTVTDAVFTGRVTQNRKGKYRLQLQGTATICVQMNCKFRFTFKLDKK